jgi:hypothetical protein
MIEFDGERKPLSAWAEQLGISWVTLRARLDMGWPLERALSAGKFDRGGGRTDGWGADLALVAGVPIGANSAIFGKLGVIYARTEADGIVEPAARVQAKRLVLVVAGETGNAAVVHRRLADARACVAPETALVGHAPGIGRGRSGGLRGYKAGRGETDCGNSNCSDGAVAHDRKAPWDRQTPADAMQRLCQAGIDADGDFLSCDAG